MPLSSHELDLMTAIFRVQSSSEDDHRMRAVVRGYCAAMGIALREDRGNVYLTRGEGSRLPCFVAHLDTVHAIVPGDRYRIERDEDGLWGAWSEWNGRLDPAGIGGDDKVGIFIALQMIADLPAAKVALFRDEEIGLLGAQDLDRAFFEDACFALECDRKGNADFVDDIGGTELHGAEFAGALSSILGRFGYAPCPGGRTDVLEIARQGIPIPVANMSCGYHHPHGFRERVNEDDVARTLALVRAITGELGGRDWRFERRLSG
ncbi:MAG: hypothetical protein ACR2J8_05165 [Thermomicrobiales bacterium]